MPSRKNKKKDRVFKERTFQKKIFKLFADHKSICDILKRDAAMPVDVRNARSSLMNFLFEAISHTAYGHIEKAIERLNRFQSNYYIHDRTKEMADLCERIIKTIRRFEITHAEAKSHIRSKDPRPATSMAKTEANSEKQT